jgi:hypothetical protein
MPKKFSGQAVAVATGLPASPQPSEGGWLVDERAKSFVTVGRPTGPWLQLNDA